MRKLFSGAAAAFAMLCLFSTCSKKKDGAAVSGAEDSGKIKIALIIESTIDDKGWCQAMYEGLVQAEKDLPGKFEFNYSEKQLPIDAGSTARQYAAQGYNIIIAHGAQYKELVLGMAEDYPDITFAFGTSAETGPDNVFTYMPESEETGYLNGLIAGLLTKTGTIGFVGSKDAGDAARYGRGFVLGARAANPEAKLLIAHTDSFSDYVQAGQLAQMQIKDGADILTGASQQALGALTVVGSKDYADKTLWYLGQDLAQLDTPAGKTKCLAASAYNYAAVIKVFINKYESGVKGGECIPLNFANGGFIFEYNDALKSVISDDVRGKVSLALQDFQKNPLSLDWKAVNYKSVE